MGSVSQLPGLANQLRSLCLCEDTGTLHWDYITDRGTRIRPQGVSWIYMFGCLCVFISGIGKKKKKELCVECRSTQAQVTGRPSAVW